MMWCVRVVGTVTEPDVDATSEHVNWRNPGVGDTSVTTRRGATESSYAGQHADRAAWSHRPEPNNSRLVVHLASHNIFYLPVFKIPSLLMQVATGECEGILRFET